MKHSTLLKLTAGIAVAACSLLAPASASATIVEKQIKWGRHHTNVFDSPRIKQIQAANAVLDGTAKPVGGLYRWNPTTVRTRPTAEFKDLDYFGDLDGPDGKLWFYTARYDYDRIEPHDNIDYVDFIMRRFHYYIYDSNMKFVGEVSDTVTYASDEVRVRQADLAPVVTRKFFNGDDKYEIMACLIYNTKRNVNRTYTKIYSVNGKKDAKGNDVCVQTIMKPVGDVLDASTADEEKFYISFYTDGSDYVPSDNKGDTPAPAAAEDSNSGDNTGDGSDGDGDGDDLDENYWEKYTNYYTKLETYGPAVDDKGPRLVNTYKVKQAQLPGDMQNTPIAATYMRNGQAYFMAQYYEQPFYNRYDSYTEDMSQREGNNLIVDIYKVADTGFEKVQTTKIPVVRNTENEKVLASYFSVASLGYDNDIIENEGADRDFIVTRQDYIRATDEYENNFYRYNSKGEKTHTIFERADSYVGMGDLPGQDPQIMFVGYDAYGDYQFNFVNMKTYETVLKQSYLMEMEDADPERLTANIDRVAEGDSYKYAIEMRLPIVDDHDNNNLRVMWLTKDGKYDHTEYVNMGKNVNYAMVYISTHTLNPHYFTSDDKREYMMLIKRALSGGGSREELFIGQATSENPSEGNELLTLKADEAGELANIMPYEDYLMVSYKKSVDSRELLTARYYMLPLDKEDGINNVAGATEGNGFVLTGNAIVAKGLVQVFDITGACVATANGNLSLDGLRAGLYIVRAAGKAAKIVVR